MRRMALVGWAMAAMACRFAFDEVALSAAGDAGGSGSDDGGSGHTVDANPLEDALVRPPPALHFTFDEPAATGFVTNTGTVGPATVPSSGQQGVGGISGSAIRFTAASDGIELPDASYLDSILQLSIEVWVYYDALATTYSTFVKKDTSYILRTCDVNTCGVGNQKYLTGIAWDAAGTIVSSNTVMTLPIGVWTHVAMTYDGLANPSVVRTYWNGVLVSTISEIGATGATFDSANPLTIGRAQGNTENFLGRLDELRLWTRMRTDEEICTSAGRTWSGTTCN